MQNGEVQLTAVGSQRARDVVRRSPSRRAPFQRHFFHRRIRGAYASLQVRTHHQPGAGPAHLHLPRAPQDLSAWESHPAGRVLQRQVQGLIAHSKNADSSRPTKKTYQRQGSCFERRGREYYLGRRPRESLRVCLFAAKNAPALPATMREKKRQRSAM